MCVSGCEGSVAHGGRAHEAGHCRGAGPGARRRRPAGAPARRVGGGHTHAHGVTHAHTETAASGHPAAGNVGAPAFPGLPGEPAGAADHGSALGPEGAGLQQRVAADPGPGRHGRGGRQRRGLQPAAGRPGHRHRPHQDRARRTAWATARRWPPSSRPATSRRKGMPFEGVAPGARILSVKVNSQDTGSSILLAQGIHDAALPGREGHQRLGHHGQHRRAARGGGVRAEPGRRDRGRRRQRRDRHRHRARSIPRAIRVCCRSGRWAPTARWPRSPTSTPAWRSPRPA